MYHLHGAFQTAASVLRLRKSTTVVSYSLLALAGFQSQMLMLTPLPGAGPSCWDLDPFALHGGPLWL